MHPPGVRCSRISASFGSVEWESDRPALFPCQAWLHAPAMTRIVRTAYRYKRPPGMRKPVTLEGPMVAIVPARHQINNVQLA